MTLLGPADFNGIFTFERQIEDHLSGQHVLASGEATWTQGGDGVLYQERGQMVMPGQAPMTAERRYIWIFEAGRVRVLFEDGRAFHEFTPVGQGEGSAHLCGGDLYQVAYDFRAFPEWRADWAVKGPRKDYGSRTRYMRA